MIPYKRSWKGRSYPLHWHENLEIVYNLDSDIIYHIDSNSFSIKPNTLLLINSYVPHSLEGVTNDGFYTLGLVDYEFVKKWTNGDYYNRFLFDSLIGNNNYQTDKKMIDIMLRMTNLYHDLSGLNIIKMNALSLELLSVLCEKYMVPVSEVGNREFNTELTKFIKQHIREEITLKDVAEQFSYNYAYTSRLIHENIGISFKDYINTLRVDLSLVKLLENNDSIENIALNVGFSSADAYLRAFKKYYKMAPTEFRSEHLLHPSQVIRNYLL